MALTNNSGNPAAVYTMEAFGNVLQSCQGSGYYYWSDPQPYHLTTKEYDPNSQLYYFNARWYDPATGRWISRDPIRTESPNQYQFCFSDPANSIDATGLQCGSAFFDANTAEKINEANRETLKMVRRLCNEPLRQLYQWVGRQFGSTPFAGDDNAAAGFLFGGAFYALGAADAAPAAGEFVFWGHEALQVALAVPWNILDAGERRWSGCWAGLACGTLKGYFNMLCRDGTFGNLVFGSPRPASLKLSTWLADYRSWRAGLCAGAELSSLYGSLYGVLYFAW